MRVNSGAPLIVLELRDATSAAKLAALLADTRSFTAKPRSGEHDCDALYVSHTAGAELGARHILGQAQVLRASPDMAPPFRHVVVGPAYRLDSMPKDPAEIAMMSLSAVLAAVIEFNQHAEDRIGSVCVLYDWLFPAGIETARAADLIRTVTNRLGLS